MRPIDPKSLTSAMPINIGWRPIPGTSQERAMACPCDHILLTGGRGWGKTEIQLARFRRNVGKGYGVFWRGIIFDKEYKNLDDLITKSKRFFAKFNDGAVFLESTSQLKWKWPTGEELLFRVVKRIEDYWSYHGHEYAFIGWNELTKYADEKLYLKMMSVNRTGFDPDEHTPRKPGIGHNGGPPLYDTSDGLPLPPIPLEVCSTTNPYGAGHNWVKRRFITPARYGQVIKTSVEVFDPKTRKDITVTKAQVSLFGTYRENTYLDPEYIAGLLLETDENILKAWIHGDWDIVAGGALDDKWKKKDHVVPRFPIPENWHVDRVMDWGSTHPFFVGWFAESNGEEVLFVDVTGNIKTISFPRGTLIQIFEWYGTRAIGTNQGLKLSAKDIADGIKEREITLMRQGWIKRQPAPGPADNQIRDVRETDVDTIEKKMADSGVRWALSDKSPGSRVQGLQLIRDRLEASSRREGPGLVFMECCTAAIETIPTLPRDEKKLDDVDTTAEDHPYDGVRYRVLASDNRFGGAPKVNFGY